jgi:hypothetical protein
MGDDFDEEDEFEDPDIATDPINAIDVKVSFCWSSLFSHNSAETEVSNEA